MVAEAVAGGVQASHLLFDSWFTYPATMRKLLAKGVHTLCMLKGTKKIFYRYQGEYLHLAAIYRKIRKRRGRAKILAYAEVLALVLMFLEQALGAAFLSLSFSKRSGPIIFARISLT
jgi:hypothetical protein